MGSVLTLGCKAVFDGSKADPVRPVIVGGGSVKVISLVVCVVATKYLVLGIAKSDWVFEVCGNRVEVTFVCV